ncbi:probable amidase At4g34880 [Mangifera indica]|uniref:probable amidase At4g34880 n=1 Tax=Mangifera indica TaxID=29780 RepID=UPI001CF98705|nr:probable amidase At4g34880 [Mangifera indica]
MIKGHLVASLDALPDSEHNLLKYSFALSHNPIFSCKQSPIVCTPVDCVSTLSFHHGSRMATNSSSLGIFLFSSFFLILLVVSSSFSIKEATIDELQFAFKQNQLTSRQLIEFYLGEIRRLNPILRGVIEVNPDALYLADKADQERKAGAERSKLGLHGIPILVKDNIATKNKMNTTAGSFALLGSVVPRHSFVVTKLIQAGAIILGKASMTEWAHFRSYDQPAGWCARSGQGKNPYVLSAETCGSSSGSAISVAANMAAGALGTETAGSILCPSGLNSVVGIKPTVGLTSRDGVIPISPRQDTVGPICRTVVDAVYILDAIVGFDHSDKDTREASKYIPPGGYKQYLKPCGLRGKRVGIARNIPVSNYANESDVSKAFELHIQTLRQRGAVVVDHLKLSNIEGIVDIIGSGQILALAAEFKLALNAYLEGLLASPVRSLKDVIAFYNKFSKLEKAKEYGQSLFLLAQETNGIDNDVKAALLNLTKLSGDGIKKLMKKNKLDAVATPGIDMVGVLAIGGFPGIIVPGGYDGKGKPFGIYFGGLKGSEPKLIEIAYGFEQATKIRKPPSFKP